MRYILGISAFYHDSAAALVRDGRVIAAAQEERFSGNKNDASFPHRAASWCLRHAGITPEQLDAVVFHEKPVRKFARVLETFVAVAPRGAGHFLGVIPGWLRGKLNVPAAIRNALPGLPPGCPVLFTGHHQAHAASAWMTSGFPRAAVLTIDGVGEWSTASIVHARGDGMIPLRELRFPHSPGLLYSAFTAYCGFRINSGEYKLMGLAPYGEPRYVAEILEKVITLHDDGSLALHPEYFRFLTGSVMTSDRFHRLFGGPPRRPESPPDQRYADVARSIQEVIREVVMRMARHAHELTGESDLCMAGGVALNCVANGHLAREGPFRRIWIQPAAGDAGAAAGAALAAWHAETGTLPDSPMSAPFLGPEWSAGETAGILAAEGAVFERLPEEELVRRAAEWLAGGNALAWFQGRMEFGPRALGNRSILADPRPPDMQRRLNADVKFRESFRPFAPVVLSDQVHEWFDVPPGWESPCMLFTAPVHPQQTLADVPVTSGFDRLHVPRSRIPAVTHIDGSARIQTADAARHPRLTRLLTRFHELTGCPVLVNTSFNVRGEPIVCSPADAWRCFLRTNLAVAVIGDCWIDRSRQPPGIRSAAQPLPTRKEHLECPAARDRKSGAFWRLYAASTSLAGLAVLWLLTRSGWLAAIAAAAHFAAALASPAYARTAGRTGMALGRLVGGVVSWIALAIVFAGIVTPLAVALRLAGRDPLERSPQRGGRWLPAPPWTGLRQMF